MQCQMSAYVLLNCALQRHPLRITCLCTPMMSCAGLSFLNFSPLKRVFRASEAEEVVTMTPCHEDIRFTPSARGLWVDECAEGGHARNRRALEARFGSCFILERCAWQEATAAATPFSSDCLSCCFVLEGLFFGALFFRRLFSFWRPSVLAQERKKEATRTWSEQDPKPQKECWVATP